MDSRSFARMLDYLLLRRLNTARPRQLIAAGSAGPPLAAALRKRPPPPPVPPAAAACGLSEEAVGIDAVERIVVNVGCRGLSRQISVGSGCRMPQPGAYVRAR